jgi:Predicted Zn-dependent protease (DUF2268)
MKRLIGFLTIALMIVACKNTNEHIDDVNTENVKVNTRINRLERIIFKDKSPENIVKFVKDYPKEASAMFKTPLNTKDDTLMLARQIEGLVSNPALDSIYKTSERVYGNMDDLKAQFDEGFKHIKYYYPKFKEPKIQTIITGFANDKLMTDSCMTIGLDFFLDKEINYAPPVFEYLKNRLKKPYFVHNIMLEISAKYIELDPNDETLLNDMIGWGKALYFTRKVMPSLPDSIILGYSMQQIAGIQAHEAEIWNHFIKENLLYTSSHTNDKYTNERPYTAEIGTNCPPRIGRWLGYLIVSKYMKNNPKITLPELMKEKDAKKIFTQSKYKPRK